MTGLDSTAKAGCGAQPNAVTTEIIAVKDLINFIKYLFWVG